MNREADFLKLREEGELWAALVDAYLTDAQPIQMLERINQDSETLYHPNLAPEWREVQKSLVFDLFEQGLIRLQEVDRGEWEITIPSHVMGRLPRGRPAFSSQSGSERIESLKDSPIYIQNFMPQFDGGAHNFAQANERVEQNNSLTIQPRDLDGLLSALRDDGLSEDGVRRVLEAIEEDGGEVGLNVSRLMGDVLTGAAGNVLAAGFLGTDVAPRVLEHVRQFLGM